MRGNAHLLATTVVAVALAGVTLGARAETASPSQTGQAEAPAPSGPLEVVVVKRAGVTAYEEASEEFSEHCRVRAKVVSFGDEGPIHVKRQLRRGQLVVTVGQEAFDAVADSGARTIPTLAFHAPQSAGPPALAPPELLLRALRIARPQTKVIAVVHGPRSAATVAAAARAAERLGLILRARRAESGPEAVRRLRELVDGREEGGGPLSAIWLPGDTDVVTPQLFQYALMLQLERGLPLVAATRQQVHAGALLAVDFSPRAAGRAAAEITNRLLEGQPPAGRDLELHCGARISVNRHVAGRLGISDVTLGELLRLGSVVE
jgi:hypothetical protein